MATWYAFGTCSVTNGTANVTFSVGTTLLANAKASDGLILSGQLVEILSITDNTHLVLRNNWTGATVTNGTYAIIPGPNWSDRTSLALDVSTYLAAVSGVIQSSDTLTIASSGSLTLKIPQNMRLAVGARVRISDTANPTTKYMEGVVTSYIGSSLVVALDYAQGSGSASSWNVNTTGVRGIDGVPGGTASFPGTTIINRLCKWGNTVGTSILQAVGLFEDASGKVGILTDTPSAALTVAYNATAPLADFNSMRITSTSGSSSYCASQGWGFNGTAWTRNAGTNAVMWGTGINNGAFEVWSTAAGDAQTTAPSNTNSKFYIAASGNIGFGTTSPSSKMEIVGALNPAVHINSTATTNFSSAFRFVSNGTVRWGFGVDYNGDNGNNFFVHDYTNGTRMLVDNSGNLGVGTTGPTAKLHVAGAMRSTPSTVAGLPVAGTIGAGGRSFVTDSTTSTFGAVATGGGSASVPVYCDGVNWRVG